MTQRLAPPEPFDPLLSYYIRNPFPVNYLLDHYVWKGEKTQELMAAAAMERSPHPQQEDVPSDGDYLWRLLPLKNCFGVFADQDIPPNRRIMTVFGEVFTGDQKMEMDMHCVRTSSNFVVCYERQGSLFSLVRASCQPNCKLECVWKDNIEYVVVVTNRAINLGDEITVDFNYSVPYGAPNKPCACGKGDKCRLVLTFPRENLKKHWCAMCETSFRNARGKYEHILIQHVHRGQIDCPYENCNHRFYHSSNYYVHIKDFHRGKEPKMRSGKKYLHDYPCPKCKHQCKGPEGWSSHVMECNSNTPCRCHQCVDLERRIEDNLDVLVSSNEEGEDKEEYCSDDNDEIEEYDDEFGDYVNDGTHDLIPPQKSPSPVRYIPQKHRRQISSPKQESGDNYDTEFSTESRIKRTRFASNLSESSASSDNQSECSSTSYHTDDTIPLPHSHRYVPPPQI